MLGETAGQTVLHRGPTIFVYHAVTDNKRLDILKLEVHRSSQKTGKYVWGLRNEKNEILARGNAPVKDVDACVKAGEAAIQEMVLNECREFYMDAS